MNITEVKEIRKRANKEAIYRIAVCQVNEGIRTGCTVLDTMSLDEDVRHKYLAIIKKALSGTFGNNLHTLPFKISDEQEGGVQHNLMKLFPAMGKNLDMNEAFFDAIIKTYDHSGRYCIMCVYDTYDVPAKSSDGADLEESREVFNYMICIICPVDLSKPGLEMVTSEEEEIEGDEFGNDLEIFNTSRKWIVGMPETAFMFPSFDCRSSNIHECLFYTKNALNPHQEFAMNFLNNVVPEATSEVAFNFFKILTENCENQDEKIMYLKYKASELDDDVMDVPVDEEVVTTLASYFNVGNEQPTIEYVKEHQLNVSDLYSPREINIASPIVELLDLRKENMMLRSIIEGSSLEAV